MSKKFKGKGPSTELMPGILSDINRIFDGARERQKYDFESIHTSPQIIEKANNFVNLSLNVQKILSNISELDGSRSSSIQTENRPIKKTLTKRGRTSGQFSPEGTLYKSEESLDLISPNVQKMLSNLPDTELVILNAGSVEKKVRNSSFLNVNVNESKSSDPTDDIEQAIFDSSNLSDTLYSDSDCMPEKSDIDNCAIANGRNECVTTLVSKPLGNYNQTLPCGIASRTPVGRKNMGKYLQVPSESSIGTNSTSSEVSRPVSLTSLGSCSSSGSSGTHQPGSVYQASAESLDSDPEFLGSQGSADSGISVESTVIHPKEYDVVAEIIDTEAKYVEDLHKVIQDYLEPWRLNSECCLHEHIPSLFNNLEEIHEFNKSFLQQLKDANSDPSATAKVFINNTGFTIYTDYCTNYPTTISVLTELMRNEDTAKYFKQVQMENNHDLPLGSYLLKPVQRILRYRMLLQRLSERSKLEHKHIVDMALTTMTSVADHINNMKRKHEIAVRIQEIQSQLYGWTGPDLTTLGELIAEGSFRVGGVKGRRHIFLFDKVLLLTKCKQDGNFVYKSHIMCSNLMLVEQVRGDPLSFHVLPFDNPRLQCTLRARSPQHKREWTGQLKRVIIENYNAAIPNHAQQLLMQLGQDVPEKEEAAELWLPLKKQYSTPHYLERRSRVRQSRDPSARRAASHDRAFPSLGSWRRKSEPNVVQQYDTKTVPTRISKIKKSKESTATFYTDFSDSENCDNENTKQILTEDKFSFTQKEKNENESVSQSIEKITNAMLHRKFDDSKLSLRESETEPNICMKLDKDELVANKADSLPRSFQLNNNQLDCKSESYESLNHSNKSFKVTNLSIESEMFPATNLENSDHPEHKIYRKSTIRNSLLQKYHAIRDRHKKIVINQVSKIIGARIANPDYEDPQKLFCSISSLNNSMSSIASYKSESHDIEFDVPDDFDMTINENEVLTEFDKRLQINNNEACSEVDISSQRVVEEEITVHNQRIVSQLNVSNSSQNSDSYYESLMEDTLNETDLGRCDSFRVSSDINKSTNVAVPKCEDNNETISSVISKMDLNRKFVRPSKAPPPIPAKPSKPIIDNHTRKDHQDTFHKTILLKKNNDLISTSETLQRSVCYSKQFISASNIDVKEK
ncbi:RhoGEF domain [Popillia japonica]|uniref:RhoGEF domain n=1 Tax=Popillia japonica TaxID=7064 RepID=A0AAW1JC33_POPJA